MAKKPVQSHSKQPAPANDSDLSDLLGDGDENGNTNKGSSNGNYGKPGNIETAALNLDHLTQGKLDMSKGGTRPFPSIRQIPFLDYVSQYMSMLCYYYPVMCGFFFFFMVSTIMMLLGNMILNPTEEFGVIKHDHSNIQSKYDLSMGEIDHWCLGGGDKDCKCEDPMVPVSRAERKSWVQSFKNNRKLVKQYQTNSEGAALDVAFLGESVVEEMAGRWMGQQRSAQLKSVETMFLNNFDKRRGAKMQGVALGIAGDSSNTVLWRLMHGEMPANFNPKVWWVSLGNNDLGRMLCSEEVVVIGILRVVEEILASKPDAQVVINSLFPMSVVRGGQFALVNDYKDSLNENNGASSRVVRPPAEPKTTRTRASAAGNPPRSMTRPANNGGGGADFPGTRRSLRFKSRAYVNPLPPRKEPPTEETMTEEAEKEEATRDKAYHKKHDKKIKRARQRQRNGPDTLGDASKHKVRKYNAQRAFMAKNRIPLWTSIEAINGQLRKFAASHERVSYFDANEIFTTTDAPNAKKGVVVLNRSRMSPRGHPTQMGYSVWEDAILKRLDSLFEVMKREQPELFDKKAIDDDDISDWVGDGGIEKDDDDFDNADFDSVTDDTYTYGLSSGEKKGNLPGARVSNVGGGTSFSSNGGGGSSLSNSVDGPAYSAPPVGKQGGDGVTSGRTVAGGQSMYGQSGGVGASGSPPGKGVAVPGPMYGAFRGDVAARDSATPGTGVAVANPMYGAASGGDVPGNTGPVPVVKTGGSMYGPMRPTATGPDEKAGMYEALTKAGETAVQKGSFDKGGSIEAGKGNSGDDSDDSDDE
jgi:hypothetical protein